MQPQGWLIRPIRPPEQRLPFKRKWPDRDAVGPFAVGAGRSEDLIPGKICETQIEARGSRQLFDPTGFGRARSGAPQAASETASGWRMR